MYTKPKAARHILEDLKEMLKRGPSFESIPGTGGLSKEDAETARKQFQIWANSWIIPQLEIAIYKSTPKSKRDQED